jgi:hypothetical protein
VTAVADEDVEVVNAFAAVGVQFSGTAVDPDPVGLRGLVDLIKRGQVRVHVQEAFP